MICVDFCFFFAILVLCQRFAWKYKYLLWEFGTKPKQQTGSQPKLSWIYFLIMSKQRFRDKNMLQKFTFEFENGNDCPVQGWKSKTPQKLKWKNYPTYWFIVIAESQNYLQFCGSQVFLYMPGNAGWCYQWDGGWCLWGCPPRSELEPCLAHEQLQEKPASRMNQNTVF